MKPILSGKTRELLSHFICGHCKKWWSISDAPIQRSKWYCPWCGEIDLYIDTTSIKKK